MKKLRLPLIMLILLACKTSFAQKAEVIKNYIETYKDLAIEEMRRTGVPASIKLAQGIHETFAGQSQLVLKSNNHFGIKCKAEWKGESVSHDDDARGECFRKYPSAADSYRDHSDFLVTRKHYASLFKLDPTDYEGWAYGLKKAGYATNPKYPQIIIKLIKEYDLQEYSLIALNRKTEEPKEVWVTNQTMKSPDKEADKMGISLPVQTAQREPVKKPDYPSGLFRINETSVVFVSQGTSFLAVAEQNKIPLNRLFEFNDMEPSDLAQQDQLVYLQRKRKVGANPYHIVMDGESIYDIAQAEGIRTESLLEYNFLKKGMQPAPGEKLYLQQQAPAMPRLYSPNLAFISQATAPTDNTEYMVHVVQPKETLFSITKKYSVSVEDVLKWNNLQSDALRTGQELRINKRINGVN